jgi:hypothetical protein
MGVARGSTFAGCMALAAAVTAMACSFPEYATIPIEAADSGEDAEAAFPTDGDSTDTLGEAGSESATDAPVDTASPPPTCSAFCTAELKACTGANAQFTSTDDCIHQCANNYKLKAGSAGDTSGNTVACRSYHTSVAATDDASATTHCVHTGASGGNTCGTWCEVYCDTVQANCIGSNKLYPDEAACKSFCASFATGGKPNDTSGNTVQCRIYHAGVAGSGAAAAATHCPHTGPSSATCN